MDKLIRKLLPVSRIIVNITSFLIPVFILLITWNYKESSLLFQLFITDMVIGAICLIFCDMFKYLN